MIFTKSTKSDIMDKQLSFSGLAYLKNIHSQFFKKGPEYFISYNFKKMDEILKKIEQQERKIDAIYASVEKLRKYFLWTFIITVATVILPLIIAIVILPSLIGNIMNLYR